MFEYILTTSFSYSFHIIFNNNNKNKKQSFFSKKLWIDSRVDLYIQEVIFWHSLHFCGRFKAPSLVCVFLLFLNAALGYKKRIKDYKFLKYLWLRAVNVNLRVLRGCLAGTARHVAKKDGRYHTVPLSFIRKTEPFLRVITPLTHVERTVFFPLKNPTAQLEQYYLTNTKQIH